MALEDMKISLSALVPAGIPFLCVARMCHPDKVSNCHFARQVIRIYNEAFRPTQQRFLQSDDEDVEETLEEYDKRWDEIHQAGAHETELMRRIGKEGELIFYKWAVSNGWKIIDFTKRRRGYDFLIEKDGKKRRVEVKASTSISPFILSLNELYQLVSCVKKGEEYWVVCISNVFTSPELHWIEGRLLVKDGISFDWGKRYGS